MKKLVLLITCVSVVFFLMIGSVAAKSKVVIYTSLENEEVVDYLKMAKEQLPDLDIQAIRLSTGELGARLLRKDR